MGMAFISLQSARRDGLFLYISLSIVSRLSGGQIDLCLNAGLLFPVPCCHIWPVEGDQ